MHDRRDLLQAAALSLAGASLGSFSPLPGKDEVKDRRTIIDTHTHFYDPNRPEGIAWPARNSDLYRVVLPKHFREVAGPHGVTGTVVIEAVNRLIDNDWLLEVAKKDSTLVGVVGRLTPGSADFAAELRRLGKDPLFRGIRIGAAQLANGLDDKTFLDHLKLLADQNLELDVNGSPDLLASVSRLGQKLPMLRVVIDHLANVKIDGKAPPAKWVEGMKTAARHRQVYCKVSALVEGTGRRDGKAPADVTYYRPVLDTVWKLFGEDRLIYGSNWPVCQPFAPYGTVIGIIKEYFGDKGKAASDKVFSLNAKAAYRWLNR